MMTQGRTEMVPLERLPLLARRVAAPKAQPGWWIKHQNLDGVFIELEPPPRLRLRRRHPSWPGGVILTFAASGPHLDIIEVTVWPHIDQE